MSRSASERAFGFSSRGLLRVLVAADPEEVLTAMEALDFIPAEHEHEPEETIPLFEVLLEAARSIFQPLDFFLSGLRVARENFAIIITAAEADLAPGRGGAGAIVVESESDRRRLVSFFRKLDSDTRNQEGKSAAAKTGIDQAQEQIEEDLAITFL